MIMCRLMGCDLFLSLGEVCTVERLVIVLLLVCYCSFVLMLLCVMKESVFGNLFCKENGEELRSIRTKGRKRCKPKTKYDHKFI